MFYFFYLFWACYCWIMIVFIICHIDMGIVINGFGMSIGSMGKWIEIWDGIMDYRQFIGSLFEQYLYIRIIKMYIIQRYNTYIILINLYNSYNILYYLEYKKPKNKNIIKTCRIDTRLISNHMNSTIISTLKQTQVQYYRKENPYR